MIISLKVLGFDENVTGMKYGQKSTKFCMNLEKKRGNQNQIYKLIIDEKEIDGNNRLHISKTDLSEKVVD